MQIFNINQHQLKDFPFNLTSSLNDLLKKNFSYNQNIINSVNEIINIVKANGDQALIDLSCKFDQANFTTFEDLIVSQQEFDQAEKSLDLQVKQAINFAFQRIKDYHLKQLPKDFSFCDQLGVDLKNSWLPINRIGVYVPGGIASYPSSVLMSVVPALVAGVKEIVITAPSSNSQINPAVIYASKICGIKKIYKIGGAQAITALALGTKSIKQVDKIVGPGNAYVAIAKKILFGEVGIDMIAGPTDVMIISNDQSNPNWIAIDALSQLEHGEDSKAFIVVDNLEFANKINDAINSQKTNLSRKNIIEKSLKNSAIMVIENLVNAIEIANFIAPEHLQLMVDNADFYVDNITNAGAIFIGEYTPEAIGDYVAGPSHTLPTSATARFASGLSVYDFLKRRSIINCNQKAFNNIAKSASIIAKCEGLTAHQLSIDIRNL